MSETVATYCQNKTDKQRDEDLCFLAAARDFHSAGPDAFHPGWSQYGDLLDAAENALASSAPALAAAQAEVARLREAATALFAHLESDINVSVDEYSPSVVALRAALVQP